MWLIWQKLDSFRVSGNLFEFTVRYSYIRVGDFFVVISTTPNHVVDPLHICSSLWGPYAQKKKKSLLFVRLG